MGTVCRSLWLPIARVNFFSVMTDPGLLLEDTERRLTGQCRADRCDEPGYIPHLRESVMRRLMEVLPGSFGYDEIGTCEFDKWDERSRPVSLTMTLRPASADPGVVEAREINAVLRDAGVRTVQLRVGENGYYTFIADHAGGPQNEARVGQALEKHVVSVFGGAFAVERLGRLPDRKINEGQAALRRYNGLSPDTERQVVESPPRGALSFYQLNILIEGLCNQSLLPAVFFEHYKMAQEWFDDHPGDTSMITSIRELIRATMVEEDAATISGRATTLRRFLIVSRGSLAWMRRSVDSVHRSLLDQMMAVSHRRARLIQLDLAGIAYERTPEMTGVATESQLRGYVMLIATKLPVITNIADSAQRAAEGLNRDAGGDPHLADDVRHRVNDLNGVVGTWQGVLTNLTSYVHTLETAVEHDWQERLLFEQEQTRSDQEAVAEIERSRHGRPESRRAGEVAYNALILISTAVALLIGVQAYNEAKHNQPDQSWWRYALDLSPIIAGALVLVLIWPTVALVRRAWQQRKPNRDSYSFEFAFRLDELTDPDLVHGYLTQPQPPIRSKTFKKIRLRRLGGWRIERISVDTTYLKLHSVAAVKVRRLHYARFEIVTEVMVRRSANNPQYFLRQCRMFGDSPVALEPQRIDELVKVILEHVCAPLAADGDLDIDRITAVTDRIYLGSPRREPDRIPVGSRS
jgi:hypothetical protein